MTHNLTLFTTLLLAPLAAAQAADAPKPAKPNILVILADDLGYGDVQCNNPERGKIPTPHIDRLAAQGMRFTDGHSSSGVCSPSRYALLTGRYHWRSRLQSGIVGTWGTPLIGSDRLTIGGLAKQHGYRTACVGKWHLGWEWPTNANQRKWLSVSKGEPPVATDEHRQAWRDIFSRKIEGGPTTRGFDLYFGTDVPNWPPYCFIENDRTIGIPSEFLPARLLTNHQASLQGPALKDWVLEPILPALGDRATKFITEAVSKSEPFLLYMPLTSPHTPLSVNDGWKGKSGLAAYADFVMETDAVVGRVLAALEKSGAADKTLVFFTSDNGCAPYIGVEDLEKKGHYPSGPLRGYKSDVWEGGHRVPFLVRWPGRVKPGSVCSQLVHQADFMATCADLLDAKLPDNVGEDSFSLLPLLQGEDQPVRETAVSCSSGGVPGVRRGSWKYIPAPGSGGWGSGGDQTQPIQLYNLAEDLGETKNLAAEQPERVAQMRALLEKLITDGRSSPGAIQKNDVKVIRHPQSAPNKKAKKDAKAAAAQSGAQPPKGGPIDVAEAATQKAKTDAELDAKYQAWVARLPPDQQAWERVLQENLGSFYLPIHQREKIAGKSNAWDYIADDPKLPRVLLIGDSVSRGYTQAVRMALAGKANVHRAPANCGPTAQGLKKIDVWLGNGKWGVIHFNFGIHDRATPIADYTRRLEQLVERMQQTGAKLVWASTTPIPDSPDGKQTAASIVERNAAAAEVMQKHNIATNDLFTAITPYLAEMQNSNDVHFNAKGYDFLGRQVAGSIEKELK